ncbi:pantetheine-phosphate adenylyltransferase [Candidatus Parvarchaeota archaeon]|jgi:pantetheine-phosphate adenylyltransferase|nr:pantetheine-phosphate adenylyltransferase [Candidatus Parvarchaeota archaeon]
MKKAVYAGSFDPITIGHEWVIRKAASLFDELVVAVGENQQKKEDFSLEEKKKMLASVIKDYKNIKIDSFKGEFLVDYAMRIKASYIIRGIRTETDLEYEKGIQYINSRLNEDITTIFLIPPEDLSVVSSSLVRSLVGSKGWEIAVKRFLPNEECYKIFVKHYQNA